MIAFSWRGRHQRVPCHRGSRVIRPSAFPPPPADAGASIHGFQLTVLPAATDIFHNRVYAAFAELRPGSGLEIQSLFRDTWQHAWRAAPVFLGSAYREGTVFQMVKYGSAL